MLGGEISRELEDKIHTDLSHRLNKGKSNTGITFAQEMFATKMIRVRPRFIGAFASYSVLSGLSNTEVLDNHGAALFRLMWFLGSAQDDYIDEIPRDKINQHINPSKLIKQSIFGKEMEFYNACYKVLGDYIEELDVSRDKKHMIKVRIKKWYDFLVHQEVEIMGLDFAKYNFENCVKYREDQNFTVGSLLVMLLNGNSVDNSRLQRLETVIPKLSFRMQIVDDIGDLKEDIEAQRPSYAVGALMEHPNEFKAVEALIQKGVIVKVTPEF